MARPSFKPTPFMRRKVAAAAGAGMSHEEIAIGLGLARNTLEKHFARELTEGAYARRLEVVLAMHAAAKRGNVAAAKQYLSMTPRVAAPPLPVGEAESAAPPTPKLGKKEQAQVDAVSAHKGTDWDGLLGPQAPVQ